MMEIVRVGTTRASDADGGSTLDGAPGDLAHDLNNLLTVIHGRTELVRRRLPEGDGSLSDLDEVLDAVDRARALSERIEAIGAPSEAQGSNR